MNYQELTIHFLKSIRGEASQIAFAKQLGYSFNIVHRWENGLRHFYWTDFIKLAKVMGWPVSQILEYVTHFQFSDLPDEREIFGTLYMPSAAPLLQRQFSRQRVLRLQKGTSKLRFEEFLMLIEILYGRVERFFNQFKELNLDQNPLIPQPAKKYRELVANDPCLFLIKNVFDLGSYKKLKGHSDEFVADLLGIPLDSVRPRIQILEQAGVLSKNGSIYTLVKEGTADNGASDRLASRRISAFMRRRVAECAEKAEPNSLDYRHAYLLYPTNTELEAEVFNLARQFYIDVRNLVGSWSNEETDRLGYLAVDLMQEFKK